MTTLEVPRAQLVVIGAGPGGYPAAFEAADHGMDVTLVTDEPVIGGVCLHRGCIPSKALLHIAKLINESHEVSEMGVKFAKPKIDLDQLRGFKTSVIDKLTGGVRELCKARGVKFVSARASFLNSQTLELKSEGQPVRKLSFEHAIVATGSTPVMPPIFAIGDPRVMDSTGALELADIPKRLLIVGGGYIGLEMSTFYAAFGSEVSVVEMTDGLLPGADRDLVRILQNRANRTFKQILLSTKVVRLTDSGNAINVVFEGDGVGEGKAPAEQTFDRVLIAIGRTPNSQDLGLENTKVNILSPRGFVEVNEKRQTADPHIYAIGDVAGEPMLAHKASKEAKVAVEAIAGHKTAFDVRAIPGVVFTDPEVAWTGLTEAQARAKGLDITIGKFPWGASGRATAMGRNDGLTKIITDTKSQRIVGVGIVGVGAGGLIAEPTLAIEMGATAEDVGLTIHAHPTLAETVAEASELAYGTTTHVFRPPR